jgi:DNA-binding beta-propeller fold protein YncE
MPLRFSTRLLFAALLGIAELAGITPASYGADDVLVVDRLSNGVYRYNSTGALVNVVVAPDPNNPLLNGPTGVALSPDQTKLFVASSQDSSVVEYNYNAATGAASNPRTFASAAQGLVFPNSITFSPDGSILYVADLGYSGVNQLHAADGSSAGAGLMGGSSFQFSGLAFTASGQLLAGGFDGNSVAISDGPPATTFSDLIPTNPAIAGVAGVFVHGNDVYVSGLQSSTLAEFDITTGQLVSSFGTGGLVALPAMSFPQSIILAPDGQSLLVGILGATGGAGEIDKYSFTGQFEGVFASHQTDATLGFTEATAMVSVVPEPATWLLAAIGLLPLGLLARRRSARRSN